MNIKTKPEAKKVTLEDALAVVQASASKLREKVVLSFGAGVDSAAMIVLILTDPRFAEIKSRLVEIVWCDLSGGKNNTEWPETYTWLYDSFVPFLKEQGLKFTIIYPSKKLNRSTEVTNNIYEYYRKGAIIPPATMGSCSVIFKVEPIAKHVVATYGSDSSTWPTMLIGYEANEAHRFADPKRAKNHDPRAHNRYPLVEAGLTREDCERLIAAAGLPVPPKSACWFCTKGCMADWRKLQTTHVDLFAEVIAWEEEVQEARRVRKAAKGEEFTPFPFISNKKGKTVKEVCDTKPRKSNKKQQGFTMPKSVSMETMMDQARTLAGGRRNG